MRASTWLMHCQTPSYQARHVTRRSLDHLLHFPPRALSFLALTQQHKPANHLDHTPPPDLSRPTKNNHHDLLRQGRRPQVRPPPLTDRLAPRRESKSPVPSPHARLADPPVRICHFSENSYNFYLSVASRVLRKSLKDGKQAPWVESEIKIQKWTVRQPPPSWPSSCLLVRKEKLAAKGRLCLRLGL